MSDEVVLIHRNYRSILSYGKLPATFRLFSFVCFSAVFSLCLVVFLTLAARISFVRCLLLSREYIFIVPILRRFVEEGE